MGFGRERVDTNGWVGYFRDVEKMRRRRRRRHKIVDLLIATETVVVVGTGVGF